jgi:acylphosphatase
MPWMVHYLTPETGGINFRIMQHSEKHVFISGRVQGVGFRHFTKTNARKLGLSGWVRNLPDGRVEVLIQGSSGQVDKMMHLLKKGPPASSVRSVHVESEKDHGVDPDDSFRVAY